MDEAKKFLERSLLILIVIIALGVAVELELEYLSPLLIYLGIVNLGYSILIAIKINND
mgnify:CR=1 FL=1